MALSNADRQKRKRQKIADADQEELRGVYFNNKKLKKEIAKQKVKELIKNLEGNG